MNISRVLRTLCFLIFVTTSIYAKPVHHYVFFAHERERITEKSFLETAAFEGAQLKYTWRELEPEKDKYDFGSIRKDLALLSSKEKTFHSASGSFLRSKMEARAQLFANY